MFGSLSSPRSVRAVLCGALAAAVAGCGPTVDLDTEPVTEPTGVARDAIVGGFTNSTDLNVFMMLMQGNNGQGSGCTATLIGARTLLTAAHCVDPKILGATSVQIWAHNKTSMSQVSQQDLIPVVETRMHPSWNTQTLGHDIAMVLLQRAPTGVTPKPWNTTSLSGQTGKALRAIGYGTTGPNDTSQNNTRREVALTIRQLQPTVYFLGNQSNKGVCHGDSGGPSFATMDGVEKVIGVHSFTLTEQCVDGADTRVDAYVGFVQQWLNEKEAPQCTEDGRCAANCPQPDIDCLCAADGQCSLACPSLTKDPDCPADCISNNVCATQTCPAPDPDCRAVGAACTSPVQCQTRKCITDAQHPDPYCSQACVTPTDCPSGMECSGGNCIFKPLPVVSPGGSCTKGQNLCALGYVCSGDSAASSVCQLACATNSDCKQNSTCVSGYDNQRFCKEPVLPPQIIQRARAEGYVPASSCSAGMGGVQLLGVLLLALRRRAKR
jgi:V8-like Glu-specific endopeptidase